MTSEQCVPAVSPSICKLKLPRKAEATSVLWTCDRRELHDIVKLWKKHNALTRQPWSTFYRTTVTRNFVDSLIQTVFFLPSHGCSSFGRPCLWFALIRFISLFIRHYSLQPYEKSQEAVWDSRPMWMHKAANCCGMFQVWFSAVHFYNNSKSNHQIFMKNLY